MPLRTHAAPRLFEFRAQDVANSAWASAVLLVQAPMAGQALRCVAQMAPQGLANLAWAQATLLGLEPPLLAALVEHTRPRLWQLNPQEPLGHGTSCFEA